MSVSAGDIVMEESGLFDAAYPNVILVPMTDDPTRENGCSKASWAIAHHVTATSKQRIQITTSRITEAQVAEIRRRIALSLGIDSD
jgi:hypothetical protein